MKNNQFVLFINVLLKKTAVVNFFQINTCQRRRTPYNAPPLTDTTLRKRVGLGRGAQISA
ncbi:hypothetical protein AM629_12365 [Photorhabdus heterorhabditis]|uniref:Uncharacterized protein n=1 Tax=Photorhabdus heterorhabditis TaxID=880156 RepID=A0ABR5KBF6_9GAMM|nr:hypothetical protein AM629_12365 [Photorhabdus heterorhabditis]